MMTRRIASGLLSLAFAGWAIPAVAQEEPLPMPAAPTPAPPHAQLAPPAIYVAQPRLAAPAPQPLNSIQFNPANLVFGVIGLGYERVLANWVSLRFEAQYTRNWFSKDDIWALGGTVRPFFFLTRAAPSGLYVSPLATLAYSEGHNSAASAHGAGWAAGGTIGYSWLIRRLVNIRVGGGVQYVSIEVTGQSATSTARIGASGLWPAVDLSLGFVF